MSIAACYDLHLYCDVVGCDNGHYGRGEAEYTGDEHGSQARRRAREAGWWISRDQVTCACPTCARAGHRPTVPT